MRYFVYRDSQIVGPFAPEELHQAGELRRDTLICEENAGGKTDGDWRPLKDVPELSEVRVLEPAFFDEAPPGLGPGGLERLELDTLGVPEGDEQGVAWIRTLFEDAEFRSRFAGLLPRSDDDPQQLSLAKSRISQLTGELEALRSRLNEVENARHAQWKMVELPKILESAATLPPPPAAPELPKPEPLPEIKLAQAAPAGAPVPAPAASSVPAPRLRIASSTPLSGSPLPSADDVAGPAPAPGLRLKISSGGGLPAAAPAPRAEPSGPNFEWQEPHPPKDGASPALPEAKPLPLGPIIPEAAPAPEEASLLPPSVRPIELEPQLAPAPKAEPAAAAPAPAPVLEPAPISLEAPPAAAEAAFTPPAEASSLQAVPLPPLPAAAPPLTAVFGPSDQPSPAAPAPSLGPVPVDFAASPVDLGAGASAPGPAVADVVARLAKPAPTQIPSPKPPRRGVSRVLLFALFALTAAVAGAFFLFLRNPRDLKTMVSMGSDQKPLGVEAADEGAPKPLVAGQGTTPSSQAPAGAASPAPAGARAAAFPPAAAPSVPAATITAPPAQTPQASAPSSAPAVPVQPAPAAVPAGGQSDAPDAAIALVKGFPLDGDRGTVGQWLQYSYAANPGDGNKEEWTAGGVDAATFLVQYQVHPGPGAASAQSINYVFEADVQRKIVRGRSDNARQLLAGGEPPAAKKAKIEPRKKKRAARKPKRRPVVRQDASKPLSLLPLPTDAELVPPSEDDSSFQDATVLRQPGQ